MFGTSSVMMFGVNDKLLLDPSLAKMPVFFEHGIAECFNGDLFLSTPQHIEFALTKMNSITHFQLRAKT